MCIVHEITADENGVRKGTDGNITVTLLDEGGEMFKRRAVKNACTEAAEESCWLVVRLNGVSVYQQGDQIVVTTKDLNP